MKNIIKFLNIVSLMALVACAEKASDLGVLGNSTGTGGSMARFTVVDNHLYVVTNTSLKAFDITNQTEIKSGASTNLTAMNGTVVETIFPYNNMLFLGTQTGMYIYGLNDPNSPNFLSTFQHIRSCDPVVVQGKYAYVTLRAGTNCFRSATNQLDILDISDFKNPKLLKTYPMNSPYGLGVDGNVLFICEGEKGLKIFDNTDPLNLKLIQEIKDIHTYDVIPKNKLLIVTGKDGIFQYNYQNINKLELLSKIPVEL